MKKKILSVLLAFVLCLSVSACSESASGTDINITNTESSETISSESAEETGEDVTVPAQTVTAEESATEPADKTDEAEQTPESTSAANTSQTAQTTPAQTTVTIPAVTEAPAPQWSETAVSGTMYINTNGVYSRISAIQGSTKVKSYSLNQAVTVIAKTDTGYYKIGDGEYIHGDYLSTSKVTAAATTTPKPAVTTTKPPAVTTTTTAATNPPVVTTTPGGTTPGYGQRPQTQEEIDFANRVFELTNIERAKEGLAPFKKMDTVTQVATVRAWELTELFSHSRPDGSKFTTAFNEKGLVYGWFGENIAAGQSTPEEVVKAWMNSPTHRDNILSDYEYMGVGYYKVPGTQYTYHWVQNFYTPQ